MPNATVMLIENAERFGISQLHQLRGRDRPRRARLRCACCAGRTDSPPWRPWPQHTDGFALAEIDLRCAARASSSAPGSRASRNSEIARMPDDARLLELARAAAEAHHRGDPVLARAENVLLADALGRAYGERGARAPIPGHACARVWRGASCV